MFTSFNTAGEKSSALYSEYGKLFEKYHCHIYKGFPNQVYYKQCDVQYGNIVMY